MDPYQITFHTWNKVAQLYQQKFMNLDLYNDTYDRFCQLVEKEHAAVLELGCGPGNITRYLLQQRPDLYIEAIDMAPAMIELARENVPGARFRVLDVRALHTVKGTYDAIMCGFCLPYLSKEDCTRLFADCARLLTTGGIAYFSTIQAGQEHAGYQASTTGDKTYVYNHPTRRLLEQLHEAGFELVEEAHKQYPQGEGVSTHVILFVRKK